MIFININTQPHTKVMYENEMRKYQTNKKYDSNVINNVFFPLPTTPIGYKMICYRFFPSFYMRSRSCKRFRL